MNRRAIEVEGLHHGGAPIPQACRVGGLVVSSGVMGMDPASGEVPEGLAEQVSLLFANVRRVMAAAGGSVGDIAKLTFFVTDRSSRQAIDVEWLDMFPDEHDRPARHTLTADLPGHVLVQCEIVAFVPGVPGEAS
jgi:2-iminobutanoate/2-iminopropanoate deaminase